MTRVGKMNKVYLLCSSCCLFGLTAAAQASGSLNNVDFASVLQSGSISLKSDLSSSGIKYAATYFISNKEDISYGVKNIKFTCPQGKEWFKGKCEDKCDQTRYPLSDNSHLGCIYDVCESVWGNFYNCASCKEGYESNALTGLCDAVDATGYPVNKRDVNPDAGTTECIKSGEETMCRYTHCNDGWNLDNGVCVENDCNRSKYPLSSAPDINCTEPRTCQSGKDFYFNCLGCAEGYALKNSHCTFIEPEPVAEPTPEPVVEPTPEPVIESTPEPKVEAPIVEPTPEPVVEPTPEPKVEESACKYTNPSKPEHCGEIIDRCTRNGNSYYPDKCPSCAKGYEFENGICVPNKKNCTCQTKHYPNCYATETKSGIKVKATAVPNSEVDSCGNANKCGQCVYYGIEYGRIELENSFCEKPLFSDKDMYHLTIKGVTWPEFPETLGKYDYTTFTRDLESLYGMPFGSHYGYAGTMIRYVLNEDTAKFLKIYDSIKSKIIEEVQYSGITYSTTDLYFSKDDCEDIVRTYFPTGKVMTLSEDKLDREWE